MCTGGEDLGTSVLPKLPGLNQPPTPAEVLVQVAGKRCAIEVHEPGLRLGALFYSTRSPGR